MKKILALLVVVISSGCATPNIPKDAPPIKDLEVFSVPLDRAWGAIIASVMEMGLAVDVSDKASGLLTTKRHVFAGSDAGHTSVRLDELMYLPSIGVQILGGGWQSVAHRMTIFAQSTENGTTRVKVTTSFDGKSGSGIDYSRLPSKGKLEADLFAAVRKNLGL